MLYDPPTQTRSCTQHITVGAEGTKFVVQNLDVGHTRQRAFLLDGKALYVQMNNSAQKIVLTSTDKYVEYSEPGGVGRIDPVTLPASPADPINVFLLAIQEKAKNLCN